MDHVHGLCKLREFEFLKCHFCRLFTFWLPCQPNAHPAHNKSLIERGMYVVKCEVVGGGVRVAGPHGLRVVNGEVVGGEERAHRLC